MASEDFSQDAVGDFLAKWNTNGTAEVVTIEGYDGKWLMLKKITEASYIPDFVKDLPENFTLKFDVIYNNWEKAYAYQQRLYVTVHETKKMTIEFKTQQRAEGRPFYSMARWEQAKSTCIRLPRTATIPTCRGIVIWTTSSIPIITARYFT